jgi:hypothetical protein
MTRVLLSIILAAIALFACGPACGPGTYEPEPTKRELPPDPDERAVA